MLPDYSRLSCVTNGTPASWAVLSSCGKYRYLLARMWDDYLSDGDWWERGATRPLMVFVMLNPSTATGLVDDPTIRRCVGFAKREKCGGILVVNLFAWRATKPKDIPTVPEAIGPHNAEFLHIALGNPMLAIGVAAWGALAPRLRRQSIDSRLEAEMIRGPLWCFGKSKHGEPRHPLMLAKDTPLISMAMDQRRFPGSFQGDAHDAAPHS